MRGMSTLDPPKKPKALLPDSSKTAQTTGNMYFGPGGGSLVPGKPTAQSPFAAGSGGTGLGSTISDIRNRPPSVSPGSRVKDSGSSGGSTPTSRVSGSGGGGSTSNTGSGGSTGSVTEGTMPAGYTAVGYGTLYNDPAAYAQDYLSQLGIDNPEMIDVLYPLVNALNAINLVTNMSQGTNIQSQADTANFAQGLMDELMTPGGTSLDPNALLAMLGNADDGSMAQQFMEFGASSPKDVNDLVMQLLSGAGVDPYVQRAMSGALQNNQREYTIGQARQGLGSVDYSAAHPYYQSLRAGNLGGYFGA